MKEATGELNMTIVTVVIIALIAAAAAIFVPTIIDTVQKRICVGSAGSPTGNTYSNGKCSG